MATVCLLPLNMVILFDPYEIHNALDEDRYQIFRRCTRFDDVYDLIDKGQYAHIDLHVPTTFNFNDMQQHPEVYIHTYFVTSEETSVINNTEREKIRDSIRQCCADTGEEYIQRGVMESNDLAYDETINLAELLLQMDTDRRDELLR